MWQVGDRVLGINDWGTGGASADEANHILRQAQSPLSLTVEFDVIGPASLPPAFYVAVNEERGFQRRCCPPTASSR